MKNLKLKILLIVLIIGIFTIGIPMVSYGTNENTAIVKDGNKAMIYLQGYNEDFQFAFSDNANEDELAFKNSALDSTKANANHIAYVENITDPLFSTPVYMWIKVDNEIKVVAREVNVQDYILKSELENVSKVSHIIEIKLGQEKIVDTQNEEGTKITKAVGTVEILTDLQNGKYQLIKRVKETEHDRLFALAELLAKNDFTDAYTKIVASKEFVTLARKLNSELVEGNWEDIKENKIYQPEETKEGDQYVLWLKGDNLEDVHFLTSKRVEDEKFVLEEIRTKLPKTYDDNTILIILGIVLVAIVVVAIRIVMLKKKEMKK